MSHFGDIFAPEQHPKTDEGQSMRLAFLLGCRRANDAVTKLPGSVVPHRQSAPEGLSICDSADASSTKSGLPPKPATYSD